MLRKPSSRTTAMIRVFGTQHELRDRIEQPTQPTQPCHIAVECLFKVRQQMCRETSGCEERTASVAYKIRQKQTLQLKGYRKEGPKATVSVNWIQWVRRVRRNGELCKTQAASCFPLSGSEPQHLIERKTRVVRTRYLQKWRSWLLTLFSLAAGIISPSHSKSGLMTPAHGMTACQPSKPTGILSTGFTVFVRDC